MNNDFERLMREAGPAVYTLAVRLTGNSVDGQDLAQETFVNAFKNWGRFRGDAEFSTWVYRICVNLWKNRVRYEKRRSFWKHFSIHSDDDETPPLQIADPAAGIEATIEKTDRQVQLLRALNRLEAEDRAIVVLRDVEDRPYEEIADLLELPLGTVKSRLARSREKLRLLFGEDQP